MIVTGGPGGFLADLRRQAVKFLGGGVLKMYSGMTQIGDVPLRPLGDELAEAALPEYGADDDGVAAFAEAVREMRQEHPGAISLAVWKDGDVILDGLIGDV